MARGRRPGVPNRNFPALNLERALEMARAIQDSASGLPTDRITLSVLLDKSPSSSGFNYLVLSSRAYGLTSGGKNADEFSLTSIGQLATSDDPHQRIDGLRKALLSVEPFRQFLTAYDKKKVPQGPAFRSFLISQAGVATDHVEQAMTQLLEDARLAGFLRIVKGSEWVDLQNTPAATTNPAQDGEETLDEIDSTDKDGDLGAEGSGENGATPTVTTPVVVEVPAGPPKVFITHGKNEEIVKQLQELLKFGQFEPVVATEHETVSKPVPDKVLEDMRGCSAAVIHVATEQRLLDESGNERNTINENVLIEIGAAMALYGRNFILLVPKGLRLPSNLQGLYRCEYEGENLDYPATMKLLKAFNDFR